MGDGSPGIQGTNLSLILSLILPRLVSTSDIDTRPLNIEATVR